VARKTGLIALGVAGLPRAASATVSPSVVTAGASANVTLRTTAATPAGTYALRVIATADSARPRNGGRRIQPGQRTITPRAPASTTSPSSGQTPSSGTSGWPVSDHIPTWAYDDGCNGGSGASPALVQQWVTYAESNCGPNATKAMSDCVSSTTTYCTPVEYLDANWIYSTGSVPVAADAQESWWLHEPGYSDAGHRIATGDYGGGNALNQDNPAVRSWFQNYVRTNYNDYPALMMDDTGASLSAALWYSRQPSSQEITSDAQLQASHEEMAASMTHTDGTPYEQIDNGIGPNPYLAMPFSMLNNPSSVVGLVAEGSPFSDGVLTNYYSTLLDQMAYIDGTANDFISLLSYDQTGDQQARRVQAATILLGYGPGHTVSWSDLETDNGDLAVWPEEGVVPTDPIQTMSAPGGPGCLAGQGIVCSTGGHTDLEVAPGVYRREFGACYDQGTAFGGCATIINTTGTPVTVQTSWLTGSYGHQITMNGGDVQSGGTVDVAGAPFTPGTSTIPADDAVLLSN
jgi:hypothetical protein